MSTPLPSTRGPLQKWISSQLQREREEIEEATVPGFRGHLTRWLGLFMSVMLWYTAGLGQFDTNFQRGIPMLIVGTMAFLTYPRRARPTLGQNLLDWAWIAVAAFGAGYIVLFGDQVAFRIGAETTLDLMAAFAGTVMVVEMARRTNGWAIPLISLSFVGYAYFGPRFPGLLGHSGFDIGRIVRYTWLSQEGIWGVAMGSMIDYVYIFLLLGAVMIQTGAGNTFTELAYALTGRMRSGPGQAEVLGSALFGTISGSAVANVVGTGTFTIPLMRRVGYPAQFAAAVEAASSTGGQIMPPVMGVAAFVMANVTAIPYAQIMVHAALPALLFFAGISMAVHFESLRQGLRSEDPDKLPKVGPLLRKAAIYLVPIVVLVVLIFQGQSLGRAGFVGVTLMMLAGLIFNPETRGNFRVVVLNSFESAARGSLQLFGAITCIGIIISMVVATGVGNKLAETVIAMGQENLLASLLLTMIASLILGMGLPTVAAYILLAMVAAPALVKMGVPLIGAHLFVFYFGIISAITPPVALAAYAAAGIANTDPMRTGWTSCRLALPAFIIPYMMVYGPELMLIGTVPAIIQASITALIGVYCLSMGTAGFGLRALAWWERALLITGALFLIDPGLITDIIGLALGGAAFSYQLMTVRRARGAAGRASA